MDSKHNNNNEGMVKSVNQKQTNQNDTNNDNNINISNKQGMINSQRCEDPAIQSINSTRKINEELNQMCSINVQESGSTLKISGIGMVSLSDTEPYKNITFDEIIIDGGNHSNFGMYGLQKNDGISTISNEEQISLTANYIMNFIIN